MEIEIAKPSDVAIVKDADGKVVCKIPCPQKLRDILVPTSIKPGFGSWAVNTYERKAWRNPNAVVLWAWKQMYNTSIDMQNGKMPSTCIVCSNESVNAKRYMFTKNKLSGASCDNPGCPMYHVLIPIKMFNVENRDIPEDIMARIMIG